MIINCECNAYIALLPNNGTLGILIVAHEGTVYFAHAVDGLQLLKMLELTKKYGYQHTFDFPELHTKTTDGIIELYHENQFIQMIPEQLDQLIAQVKTAMLIGLAYYDYLGE